MEALGNAGHNLSSEVWWTPSHPFKSSLTGETAAQVAEAFTKATSRPWTQPIGFAHALFELAVDVMKRAGDPTDGDVVAQAIAATKLDTLVGPIAWDGENLPPFAAKNIAKTPLVGGQWRLKDGGGYDLVITDNKTAPNIPVGGKMEADRLIASAFAAGRAVGGALPVLGGAWVANTRARWRLEEVRRADGRRADFLCRRRRRGARHHRPERRRQVDAVQSDHRQYRRRQRQHPLSTAAM